MNMFVSDEGDRRVAIFTLNWNGEKLTRRLLQSFSAHCQKYPIFVFDNGSKEIPPDEFKNSFQQVEFVRDAVNHGFAGGVNNAVRHLNGLGFDFVYEINNDCLVSSDPVGPCLAVIERHPKAVLVGSRFLSGAEFDVWRNKAKSGCNSAISGGDQVVSGCAMLINCRLFSSLGGLDERFFTYHEELEFGLRAVSNGCEVIFCPESTIGHFHEGSDFSGNAVYYRTRNAFLLKKKHPKLTCLSYMVAVMLPRPWRTIFSDSAQWKAWSQGLLDGLNGRFHRRGEIPSTRLLAPVFILGSLVFFPVIVASLISRTIKKLVRKT